MKVLAALFLTWPLWAAPRVVSLPGQSPIVNFRIVFLTGSAHDPKGKEGLAALTAAMLSQGGTRLKTYRQILDELYPMASRVDSRVDKEMTVFVGATHVDNLEAYYGLLREMLLNPGWREEDLKRLRDQQINYLRVSLRENNEEELGKEVLYAGIFRGTPYEWHSAGKVSSLSGISLDDLKTFYRRHYTRANLILGIGGGYPRGFVERVRKDFERLPEGPKTAAKLPPPPPLEANRVTLVEKKTRSVALSLGFPISVKRGDPDYAALLVASSYLGQHRNAGGVLYERIREARGLNYGDYAYIEHFPEGMFRFEPPPNVARQHQVFQIWIRPVEPPNAHFALRLALFELDRFLREGLSETDFRRTVNFLSKYVNLLMKTKDAELGYAIDSLYYGIPNYSTYLKGSLARLTREDVHRAVRAHLRADRLQIAIIGENMADLRERLLRNAPSPITYNAPKPKALLEEDKLVEKRAIELKPENVIIVPVEKIFE